MRNRLFLRLGRMSELIFDSPPPKRAYETSEGWGQLALEWERLLLERQRAERYQMGPAAYWLELDGRRQISFVVNGSRQCVVAAGAENLPDHELLELMLFVSNPRTTGSRRKPS